MVERAAFSPDGSRFVAGDLDGGLKVRDRSGRIIVALRVPPAGRNVDPKVRAVAWSPDGEHIAVDEYGGIRIRGSGLAELAMIPHIGGPMAFGDGGRHLAMLARSSVSVMSIPVLEQRGHHALGRGAFDSFVARCVTADPAGMLIAAADDGGSSETAMGEKTAQGEPQVTLMRAGEPAAFGAIERGKIVSALEFDRWRGRLLAVCGSDVGVWSRDGEAIGRFAPGDGGVRAIAVSERWIATVPEVGTGPRIDFFDPASYELRASTALERKVAPPWIVASPDGRILVMPELPVRGDFALRTWTVA